MAVYSTPPMGTYGSTWQHQGYSGAGNVQGLLGSCTGRPAIVCGNAASVFAELEEAKGKLENPALFAVNDVGMYIPNLDHWVSLHADHLPGWKVVRWQHAKGEEKAFLHSSDGKPGIDYVWEHLNPIFALSGYFAMQLAYLMGCAPIVLCGCPGSPSRRFFEAKPRDTFGYGGSDQQADRNIQRQVTKEMERLPEFKAVVRSMGGWTRTYFGPLEG